jgi:uncharacterized membrane protein YeaQ/YmgE (transglycosylase-associated protein family)
MTWTFNNLIIQIIAGIVGGHAIAAVAKEHGFGALGHTVTGALGGAFGGYFLQTLAVLVVDSNGNAYPGADQVTQWLLQAMTGLVAGAIVTMTIGFAKHTFAQHQLERR